MLDQMNRKTISDKWLELLFQRLQDLNLCYMRMHEGCNDLIEYCQSSEDMIRKTQYKNTGFMITYLKNMLANARALFEKIEFEKIKEKIDLLDKLQSEGIQTEAGLVTVFEIEFKDSPKIEIFKLTRAFNYLINKLDEVYNEIIIKLQDILFIDGNVKRK